MNHIYVVIAVDTVGALAANTLQGFVYLVDTNNYLGSWQEGTSQLHTVCQDSQIIVWTARAIDASNQADIQSFSGSMVSRSICTPQLSITQGDGAWAGRVETQGAFGSFPYTISLALGSKMLSFNAFLKVV